MLFMLTIMSFLMTMIFLFMNHPLSMGLILLIQTMLISLISGMYTYSFWFSYILFLVMIGGMLVLFIYMTSLASNEMFNFSMNILMLIMFIIMVMFSIYIYIDYMMLNPLLKNSNMIEMFNKYIMLKNENMLILNMMYNKPNYIITLMLVNYLFLTLIATVKITDIKYGPLRQKF